MFFARSALALLVPLAMFSGAACTETGNQVLSSDAGAAQDAEADGGIPCDATGVSKGPWTLAMNSSSITIRWESCRMGAIGDVLVTPEGTPEGGNAPMTVTSTENPYVISTTYTAPLNPNAPPDYAGTFYMHDAHLSGLSASTCFDYALVADPTNRKGKFCTSRNPGEPIRFLAIGDTNPTLGPATGNVLAHTLPMSPDFIVHVGDIQYYDSTVETWGSWFPIMQPMLSAGAFFPAIGNHEAETVNEYADYVVRFFGGAGFDGPMAADAQDQFYRYTSGGVWFFVLDTELALDPTSAQYQWLAAELADATTQPGFRFSIVYFHKPFVTCGDTDDNLPALLDYGPMFKQYKVPLVIQGHMHGYERFTLPGITYLTAAGGGGALGDVSQNIGRPECASRTTFGRFYSATVIDIDSSIHGVTIDDSGTTQDSFDIALP